MVLSYFTLAIALSLSVVAAWYSIIGLTAIFASAVVPIIIMGGILEVAKVTVTVWLHEYWRQCRLAMKLYLVPAVVMLMIITSMGIFGFLSKAHLDQAVVSGDSTTKIAILDEKIRSSRENIDTNRRALKQMDDAVDQLMSRTTDEQGATKAANLRRNQQGERTRLQNEIAREQQKIQQLNEERAPVAAEVRKVEAEVGPIKYIAALIYGDNPDASLLERAVRWVIIILVIVFDPLAIMMVLASTESMAWERKKREDASSEPQSHAPVYTYDNFEKPTAQELDEIVPESDSTGYPAHNPWPFPVEEEAKSKPKIRTLNDLISRTREMITPRQDVNTNQSQEEPNHAPTTSDATVDNVDRNVVQPAEPTVLDTEPITVRDTSELDDVDSNEDEFDTPELKAAKTRWKEENPRDTLKHQRQRLARGDITELPWLKYVKPTNQGFGTEFPSQPDKGDTFVRTDVVPSMLFKFNGDEWIAVDKNNSDSYTYDIAYIDFLIDSIARGEYDPDLLTASEQDQVAQRLQNKSNG